MRSRTVPETATQASTELHDHPAVDAWRRLRPEEASRLRAELIEMAERAAFVRSLDYDAMSPSERAVKGCML